MTGDFRGISFDSPVTWTKPGNWSYPVQGIAKNFIYAHTADGPVLAANVLVTARAGLYQVGDVITVAMAELEAGAP
jgi:hypothetical protein